MARDGLFDDVDACLHWHPWSFACVMNMRSPPNTIRIAFRGRTAHAGMQPWSGRSALDGLELAAHAINLMREHVEPTARTHYIYEAGGEAPNVVPDYARMLLLVRDVDREHVVATTEWVRQIAEGAAASRRRRRRRSTSFRHARPPAQHTAGREDAGASHARRRARVDGRGAGVCARVPGEHGSPAARLDDVIPLQPEVAIGGSSDVADVSWNTPTMGVVMPTAPSA